MWCFLQHSEEFCRWQKIICDSETTKKERWIQVRNDEHPLIHGLHHCSFFSVCFQSVVLVLTFIVSRSLFQIETKQKYSFAFVKDEILALFFARNPSY